MKAQHIPLLEGPRCCKVVLIKISPILFWHISRVGTVEENVVFIWCSSPQFKMWVVFFFFVSQIGSKDPLHYSTSGCESHIWDDTWLAYWGIRLAHILKEMSCIIIGS